MLSQPAVCVDYVQASKIVARAFPDLLPGEEHTSDSEEDEVSFTPDWFVQARAWR